MHLIFRMKGFAMVLLGVIFVALITNTVSSIAVDDSGSGVFTNSASGDQLRYTMAKEFDYDQKAEQLCTTWAPGDGFGKGNYEVEIYNKGYLAGSTSFRLK